MEPGVYAELYEHARPACRNCRYWRWSDGPEGECRRNAPVGTAVPFGNPEAARPAPFAAWRFPLTDEHDWCGAWEAGAAAIPDPADRALAMAVLAGDHAAARALADRVRDA